MTQILSQLDSEPVFFEQADFIPKDAGVFHGFFGRRGGVSRDIYASLNCGPGAEDNPAHVIQNRKAVSQIIGCEPDNLLSLHQVHSAKCLTVSEGWAAEKRPEADAFVTDVPGVALGILTADCAPVLFYGQKDDGSAVIGAAHAGWCGALRGVLEATVQSMGALGAQPEGIRAVIGPCIGKVSYEVSIDFAEPFIDEDEANERFFMNGKDEEHLMFDLSGYCAFKLAKAGLKNVFIKDLDTFFNEEDFFSYRRTTHRKEKDYGRQISAVMIHG